MPEFILTHRFPSNFRGSPATAAAAKDWFDQIANTVVSRSDVAVEARKLGACGGDTEPNAYTIVNADDLEAAVALAGGWPLLERGAGVEVRQLTTKEFNLTPRP
jgi:hypothetical protein